MCLIHVSKISQLDSINKNTGYKLTKLLILPAEIIIHIAEILQRERQGQGKKKKNSIWGSR